MNNTETLIFEECRSIAETILHNYNHPNCIKNVHELWTHDDREHLAQKLFDCAKKEIEWLADRGDAELVLRAVRYLGAQAMPPMRTETSWFSEGLHVLIVLTRPYYGVPEGGEPFFEDIRQGLKQAEEFDKD